MTDTGTEQTLGVKPRARWVLVGVPTVLMGGVATLALQLKDPIQARAALIAGICLVLWLSELIPLYATTLVLWASTAIFLGPLDADEFSLPRVLSWAASPVIALFFGGFALSAAASKYGIDVHVANWMVRVSRGHKARLLLAVMAGTALLSMWMSNVAAATMMVATLRPLLEQHEGTSTGGANFRKALLLGIAFAADFGGMGTPIGTGPNLIALGAALELSPQHPITFAHWVLFAAPLTILMNGLSYLLLVRLHRVRGSLTFAGLPGSKLEGRGYAVVAIFFLAATAWLTEPLHGVSAGVTALVIAAILFASRLLDTTDLTRMEWNTLLLVAGGLTFGELLERSGLATFMASAVDWQALPPTALLLAFISATALLSALASNTAAAVLLIQIGLGIIPLPSFAVLVAMGASMGVPFVISTPPNAMSYGQGGLHARDFAMPGMILMIFGCILLALTGPAVLRFMGVP